MNRLLKIVSVAVLCLSVVVTEAEARGRNNVQQGQSQNGKRQPGNQGQRPGGGQPGNQGQRPGGGQPGNQGQRPGGGQPGNQGQRPGGGRPGNQGQRPGGGRPGNQGQRPGGGQPGNPGQHPGGAHHFNPGPPPPGGGPGYGHVPSRPPYRPYMPARPVPFRAPAPPPGFRPAPGVSLFGSILGVAVGTAINASINYLLGNGYAVAGYTSDAVYVNNVVELNMLWPNATLYYGAGGVLRGSEFVYSTPYYDQGRYNMTYSYLTGAYGMPVSTMPLQGGGMRVNWFGYNGQYVSLQFQPATAYDGSYRYFTTLSFGI